jgi:hypothetical protein
MMSKLSGDQELSRLTPAQIDRLELGHQQAITNDRRSNRHYVASTLAYRDVLEKSS